MLIAHLLPLLLREGWGEVEKIGLISGCLWSLSQTPFSLPKQAQGVTGVLNRAKNSVAQVENQSVTIGTRQASELAVFFYAVWYVSGRDVLF